MVKWSWLSPSPAWGDVSNKQILLDENSSFMQSSQNFSGKYDLARLEFEIWAKL